MYPNSREDAVLEKLMYYKIYTFILLKIVRQTQKWVTLKRKPCYYWVFRGDDIICVISESLLGF